MFSLSMFNRTGCLMYIKYIHTVGLWVSAGHLLPTPRSPLRPFLPGLCCRGLSCMDYIPSPLEFCLLVGFGQCRASQEIRGREEESSIGEFTSLFPSLWHASLSLSSGHCPSLHNSVPLDSYSARSAPFSFGTGVAVACGYWPLGYCFIPGSFLTLPTPL